MNIALLGADADTLAIAAAIAASRRDQLVGLCECPAELTAQLAQQGLAPPVVDHWEALLDADAVDAVVVAYSADEDRRAEQLRKFAQVSMPVLAMHPLFSSMIVYYELDMISRDTRAVIVPYLFERWNPAVVELSRLCQPAGGGSLGQIEQLTFERHLHDRSRASVLHQFARDADLLRSIGGEVTRLHGMGPALGSTSYGNLTVQMSGSENWVMRWSVAPAEDHPWGRLTLVGSAGRAVLTMPGNTAAPGERAAAQGWNLELSAAGSRLDRKLDGAWNPADMALASLAKAIAGEPFQPEWVDAARSAELMETIDRSLKRGRTIELHREEYSEASTFKGIMSAVGCCLLIVGLGAVVVVGVLEDFLRRRIPLVPRWPYLLLGVLGFFLLLQLLLLAAKREPVRADSTGHDPPGGDLTDGDDLAD